MKKLLFLSFLLISGCSMGLSLDERYQQAYKDVVSNPTADNVARYMSLSKEVSDRDMYNANRAAEAATIESDKGFTEYFKKYGSEDFKNSHR